MEVVIDENEGDHKAMILEYWLTGSVALGLLIYLILALLKPELFP